MALEGAADRVQERGRGLQVSGRGEETQQGGCNADAVHVCLVEVAAQSQASNFDDQIRGPVVNLRVRLVALTGAGLAGGGGDTCFCEEFREVVDAELLLH